MRIIHAPLPRPMTVTIQQTPTGTAFSWPNSGLETFSARAALVGEFREAEIDLGNGSRVAGARVMVELVPAVADSDVRTPE